MYVKLRKWKTEATINSRGEIRQKKEIISSIISHVAQRAILNIVIAKLTYVT